MRLLLVLLISFSIAFLYSFLIGKIFKSKILLFFPTLLGILWIIYTALTFKPEESVGFDGIAMFLAGLVILLFILGNLLGALIFRKKRRR